MEARFALELSYIRGFTREFLARTSVREMSRMEGKPLAQYAEVEDRLKNCFASVVPGDKIIGFGAAQDQIIFYLNGVETCQFSAPDIRARFFSIWLGAKSRDQMGMKALKG